MCGISGIISSRGFDTGEIIQMTNLVRHRGPDDEGYMLLSKHGDRPSCLGGKDTPEDVYSSETFYRPEQPIKLCGVRNAVMGFGHRRLSIIDLSPHGHMPMSDHQQRYFIVYNGEIYNYIELRAELKTNGYHFYTQTDTEVLLAAYDKWGPACQEHLSGMWAFAIYDVRDQTLFLSRDRFGIKPLYYYFTNERKFCFSSEIKQFTAVGGWDATLNRQRAADYLFHSLTDHTDETLFMGVFQLPPGHHFLTDVRNIKPDQSGRVKAEKWYKPIITTSSMNFDDSVQMFRTLFAGAVSMHLRSDVPVGSALSGGLDSSSIVCLVNRLLREEGKDDIQKTFSSESEDDRFSERKWMDIVVNNLQVQANFVYPKPERLPELMPLIIWHQDEPYQSQQIYLAYHVFEMARKHGVKVMLNGHGSDEYLSAYGDFRKLRWRQHAKQFRFRELAGELSYYRVSNMFRKLWYFLGPVTAPVSDQLKHWHFKNKVINRTFRNIFDEEKLGSDYLHPDIIRPFGSDNVQQIVQNKLFHSPSPRYLKYEDRNAMAHSVEVRVPFLDHRLVELCTSLPVSYLNGKGENKRILAHAMKGILPEETRLRKDKKGFITPERSWVLEGNAAYYREKIREAVDISNGIIRPESLIYFDRMVAGKVPFSHGYLRIILFSEWIRIFHVRTD